MLALTRVGSRPLSATEEDEDKSWHLGSGAYDHPLRSGGISPVHGYEPEPVAEKVHRAVTGLGELMDGYEFHYPGELSPDNLDDVRSALAGHDIYCIASGLHVDPRFGKGGLVNPDPALRAEARRIACEAAEFAGSLGAHFIIWPGIEGYNYPFQTPYVESWNWLIEGMGQAAEICARHGVKLLLEHKNSEPAMKILMRNIGMCLYVVHKLQAQGLSNVQINMDWQHLIMNGEHLPEYAALLASDGLLGHLHANDGWGQFDDDNMVGTTRFMETLELALELRRCGYEQAGRPARVRPLPLHRGPGRRGQALAHALAVHRHGGRAHRRRSPARGSEP